MYATSQLAEDNFSRGYQLGDYSLIERIGRGGEGVIWSAWDNRRGRVVAIKIIPAIGEEAHIISYEFERQVHLLASLEHPHILPIYEFGAADDNLYIVMRYSCVGPLANRLLGGGLPLEDALRYTAQMVSALSYLHKNEIIHRDLKPNNMLLDGQMRVYLSDFGLAKHLTQATMPLHTGRGTGPYAPYEQHIQFSMSAQSDIFSMGIVIYELLTGRVPFEGTQFLGLLQKEVGGELPDVSEVRPDIPPEVTAVLRQLTAFRWQDRPRTAVAAFDLLLEALPNLPQALRAELRHVGLALPDDMLVFQDGQYLLDLFLASWDDELDEFPARLTHLALMDAAFADQDDLTAEARSFLLRGALVHDYHADFWWQKAAGTTDHIRVCEQIIANEEGAAVGRAINRLREETKQPGAIPLKASTQNLLLRLAADSQNWNLRDGALAVIAQTAETPAQWRELAFSARGDTRLAEIALNKNSHARQAAQIIGQVKSETAVQALLDAQSSANEEEIGIALQIIQQRAGSLPGIVPFRQKQKLTLERLRERLISDREGLSIPRTLLGLAAGVVGSIVLLLGLFSQPAVQMEDVLLAPYPVSGIVTIVAIDDESLAEYGRWDAWPRSLHAQLIERLAAAGARTIALDIVFDASSTAAEDAQLVAAMEKAGNIVQPILGQGDAFSDTPGVMRFEEGILPQADFLNAAAAVGHTNILHDEDGYVRQIPTIIMPAEEGRFLSLPLAALQVFLGGNVQVPQIQNNILAVAGRRIPVGSTGEMSIYYAGPPAQAEAQTFTTVSYRDVLAGNVSPDLFKDKIVLVGITATSEPDSYLTPVSDGRPMYGVEILANIIEAVWSEQFIVLPGVVVQVVVLLVLGVLTGLVCTRPWSGLALALVLASFYFIFVMVLFEWQGIMLNVLYPFMTIALSYALVTSYRFSIEVRNRREMVHLFEMNVSPARAQAAMTAVQRGDITLGGQIQEITALNVHIFGFNTVAEMYDPGTMMAHLRQFQEIIRQGIMDQEGTVVQIEGERLSAIFNAPLPQSDHARRAVFAVFAIQDGLAAYHATLAPGHEHRSINFQYGISSGQALVGNIGSEERYRYGALGEAVTIASQLAEQAQPAQCFVGETTKNQVTDLVKVEALPPVMLKGRQEPLIAYTAVRRQ